MTSTVRFIQTNSLFTNKVGVGLSTIVGPTGPQGLLGPTGGQGGINLYYGSFYDTTIQPNVVGGNTGIAMTYNSTALSNQISITGTSKILFKYGGVYNIQFSAQFDKTDSGTDEISVWLSKNGSPEPYSNTRLSLVGNNAKVVAAWNFMMQLSGGDYLEMIWASSDQDLRIYAEGPQTSPYTSPGIPSVILTVQQVA
jgi:hypothetical protein